MSEIVAHDSVPETLSFQMELHASNALPLFQARRLTALAAKDALAHDAALAGYQAVPETFTAEWRAPYDGVAWVRARLVDLVRAVAYQKFQEERRAKHAVAQASELPVTNARGVVVIPTVPGVYPR